MPVHAKSTPSWQTTQNKTITITALHMVYIVNISPKQVLTLERKIWISHLPKTYLIKEFWILKTFKKIYTRTIDL